MFDQGAGKSRKSKAAVRTIPVHESDFNPIENAFAKLKALLRKAAQRSVEGLWAAIAAAVSNFSPQECTNFFTAAGYDSDAI